MRAKISVEKMIKSKKSERMQPSSSAKSITLIGGVNTFVHLVVEIVNLRDLRMAATAQS